MMTMRNSKKGELSSLGLLLIAAVVLGWYFFFGKGANVSPEETMASLEQHQQELESQYLDADGKVSEDDLDEILQEYYDKASHTKGVSKCRLNDNCVAMELKDGTRYVYVPEVEGLDSGGEKLEIMTYEPCFSDFYDWDVYSTPFDNAAETIRYNNSDAFRFDMSYDEYSVSLESILDMEKGKIIIWNGHGAYDSELHSIICTGVPWDDDLAEEYGDDVVKLSGNSGKRVGITAEFIENNMEDGALEGSIIYMGICSGAVDGHLMKTLEDKGARTVYGFTGRVHHTYDENMAMGVFAEGLADPNTSTFDALNIAKEKYGYYDTGECEGTKLTHYGDTLYTLNEMIDEYGPYTQTTPPEIQIDPQGESFYAPPDDQTAPMPDHVITEGEVIGYWTDDEYDEQPVVVQVYKDGGTLKYRMFEVVLGDGSGFGLANGHSIFEFNDGIADLMGNQGSLYCTIGDSSDVYKSFSCFDADEGVMSDQEYGETWYRWDSFPYQDLVYEHYGY